MNSVETGLKTYLGVGHLISRAVLQYLRSPLRTLIKTLDLLLEATYIRFQSKKSDIKSQVKTIRDNVKAKLASLA